MRWVLRSVAGLLVCSILLPTFARAWDYEGHRVVNLTALELLPPTFPAWVQAPETRERIAFLAGELDRWRNTPHYPLRHANHPDHYLDLEDLPPLDLTITNLPPFRYDFVAHIARQRAAHPERFRPIVATNDLEHTRALPGFLPWAIAEDFARLKSAFSYLKAYETSGKPEQVANARANVLHLMGVMGHAVGDATQPLHTTIHYNGWVGPNPKGYLSQRTFHSWIDGGYLRKVGLNPSEVRARARPAQSLRTIPDGSSDDPVFRFACRFVGDQFERMEPLYEMEKAGKLTGEPGPGLEGKAYLVEQLGRAATALADLWLSAWEQAPPTASSSANSPTQHPSGSTSDSSPTSSGAHACGVGRIVPMSRQLRATHRSANPFSSPTILRICGCLSGLRHADSSTDAEDGKRSGALVRTARQGRLAPPPQVRTHAGWGESSR